MSHAKTVECEMTQPNLIHQAVSRVLQNYPGINIQIAPDPTQNTLKLRQYHGQGQAAIIISQDRQHAQGQADLGVKYGDIGFIYNEATGKYSMQLDDMDEPRINRSVGASMGLGPQETTKLLDEVQSVYAALDGLQKITRNVRVNQGAESLAPMNDAQAGAGWGMVVEVDEDDLRRLGISIPR